jgi:hypothetical protein
LMASVAGSRQGPVFTVLFKLQIFKKFNLFNLFNLLGLPNLAYTSVTGTNFRRSVLCTFITIR